MQTCAECGAEATAEDRYCPDCGKRLVSENTANLRGSTQGFVTLSDVQYKLGMVYFKKGAYQRAVDAWEIALKDQPENAELKQLIEDARTHLEKAGGDS